MRKRGGAGRRGSDLGMGPPQRKTPVHGAWEGGGAYLAAWAGAWGRMGPQWGRMGLHGAAWGRMGPHGAHGAHRDKPTGPLGLGFRASDPDPVTWQLAAGSWQQCHWQLAVPCASGSALCVIKCYVVWHWVFYLWPLYAPCDGRACAPCVCV
jgi:hypothetical protein